MITAQLTTQVKIMAPATMMAVIVTLSTERFGTFSLIDSLPFHLQIGIAWTDPADTMPATLLPNAESAARSAVEPASFPDLPPRFWGSRLSAWFPANGSQCGCQAAFLSDTRSRNL